MPVSAILWWLVVLLLVLTFPVLAVWPRLHHLARLLGLAACVCGVLMLVLTSEPMWWVFCACTVCSALVGGVDVHRRQHRGGPGAGPSGQAGRGRPGPWSAIQRSASG